MISTNDIYHSKCDRSRPPTPFLRGLVLVTNNERELHRVPELQIENWATLD